jgi:hypothetical protein
VIVFFAERIPSSIALKIWSPLMSVSILLPGSSAGPSRTPIERWNWPSAIS